MTITQQLKNLGVVALATTLVVGTARKAPAVTFTISNTSTNLTVVASYPVGQSFTPSVQGNAGTGTPPGSGTVYLKNFSIGGVTQSGSLFILSSGYIGAAASLSTSTTGYVGSTSTITGSAYDFGAGLALNVNTQYFAYTNADLTNALYSSANPYHGGNLDSISFGGAYAGAAPGYDYVFSATFDYTPPAGVPFEFSPSLGIISVATLGGLHYWRKNRKKQEKK